jgi:hypothetical protein
VMRHRFEMIVAGVAVIASVGCGGGDDGKRAKTSHDPPPGTIALAEANAVELYTKRSDILASFGKPKRISTEGRKGRGPCLIYNVVGAGENIPHWQFCFDKRDRLSITATAP